ncbi:hypothetical protein AVEN_1743-1 [Araneus ventricosus]|uniref:Uncharacterized protein n=1 Tax=Araneus ventricosus TaxID=182803 RepID=A0A4Y2ICJ4_ARAVE|nr:hypothetical protein AVEN_1743-1 [Araneus ventricosus]
MYVELLDGGESRISIDIPFIEATSEKLLQYSHFKDVFLKSDLHSPDSTVVQSEIKQRRNANLSDKNGAVFKEVSTIFSYLFFVKEDKRKNPAGTAFQWVWASLHPSNSMSLSFTPTTRLSDVG